MSSSSNPVTWQSLGLANYKPRAESAEAKRRRLKGCLQSQPKQKPCSLQTTLTGSSTILQDTEKFGDILHSKSDSTFRIMFENISNLPLEGSHYKNRQLIDFLWAAEPDLLGMNELGLYWPKLDVANQMHERLLKSPAQYSSTVAYNTTEHEDTDMYLHYA
jgi:hypothetical protein